MPAKQLRLPKCGGRRYDNHPRQYLFATMHLLGQVEDRALAAIDLTEEEWAESDTTDEGLEAQYAELDRCIEQSRSFYATVIAPVCRSWWTA